MRLLLAVVAVAAALVAGGARSADGQTQVSVFFLQGEQLGHVTRSGSSATDALRALLTGPTRSELKRGFRTYVPAHTPVNGVSVTNGLATVDLGNRFVAGGNMEDRLARLAQLVATLTGPEGASRVQLLIDGKPATGLFPGIATSGPVTLKELQTPNVATPKQPPLRLPAPEPAVKTTQQRLIELGYLVRGDDDGRFGSATQNAVLAFQKWEGLSRTGLLNAATKTRLSTAVHPAPVSRGGPGKRAEVLLDRQVALLINNNTVVRAIAVSTGKPSTPTPPGSYHVYAKITRWWSTPFREWLPWALPFNGGIAFHELGDVPAYPASHGCVRQLFTVAKWTYAFAYVGMPVKVIANSTS
ncbi:MAG TPA: L,D-transpeptidase family protein [Gaiellaceae bacterium]|jgi:lipoprotein-anchoring transpeptidase ErfK/SrfK|nr:L,D-transpeptidase family protein [Gaiellaceae bacterium]